MGRFDVALARIGPLLGGDSNLCSIRCPHLATILGGATDGSTAAAHSRVLVIVYNIDVPPKYFRHIAASARQDEHDVRPAVFLHS